jgi:RNA polymerase sigma-70 factor (ECF subfamily)
LEISNQKIFGQIFNEFYINLCRFAYTYLKDEDIAEEVVQELFISLWEQRDTISIKTTLRAYLYTSIKNRSLNYIRNHKTRAFHEDEFANNQLHQVDYIINFCEKEELNTLVIEAINELPEQCRKIFELSRNEGLSYREIAEKMIITSKTVEKQMGIALKKLRSKLAPYLTSIIACL